MISLRSRNLIAKLPVVEDVDGRLFVLEIFVPTIERENKQADEHDRHRMGYSRQNVTWKNMVVLRSIGNL